MNNVILSYYIGLIMAVSGLIILILGLVGEYNKKAIKKWPKIAKYHKNLFLAGGALLVCAGLILITELPE